MKKFNLGIVALVLGIAASAFTAPAAGHNVNTIYRFDGTNAADITDYTKYTAVPTPPASCNGGDVYPCYLSLTQSISTWMSGKDADQVLDAAPATKH